MLDQLAQFSCGDTLDAEPDIPRLQALARELEHGSIDLPLLEIGALWENQVQICARMYFG